MPATVAVRPPRKRNAARTSRIGLRATPQQEELLRLGAEVTHKSLTDFILGSATQAAESALLDQRLFLVTDEQYDEFVKLLDRPVQDKPGLRALFARKDPWDED